MSFFSWMRTCCQSPDDATMPNENKPVAVSFIKAVRTNPTHISMQPSAIAEAVIVLREENIRAKELCAEANCVIKAQEHELKRLRDSLQIHERRSSESESSLSNSKTHVKGLQAVAERLTSSLNEQSSQLTQAKHMLRRAQEEHNAWQNETLQARLTGRVTDYGDLYDDQETTADTISELTQHADLRPIPFVVVLIDGDSYRFPDDEKASDIRGPEIAHDLHREVSKFILSHPQIPPHAKIVVRIFCNRSGMQGKISKTARTKPKGNQPVPKTAVDRLPSTILETMVKIAETYPLFDYLDCGGGKERVDDKLRENCHLYVADNNCHTVFLAVCNDNGYVRMLERYNGNPIPAAKIVLLTNGGITPEIAKLSFPKVELNGVFSKRYQKKRAQGSSGKMGPVFQASGVHGFQTVSDYDLDYTDPRIRDRMGNTLKQMRSEKQMRNAHPAMFARLPYETNERYEERLRALLPFSHPHLSHSRVSHTSVSVVGLRKSRPAGIMATAPILPFLLRFDNSDSAYFPKPDRSKRKSAMEEVQYQMSWALD